MNGIFAAIGVTLVLLTAVPATAQQVGKIYRIGFLTAGAEKAFTDRLSAFREGLRERGYVEGKNVVIDERYAEGRSGRVPALAAELVRMRPDVIVTHGGQWALAADRAAAKMGLTIPMVFAVDADPVKKGVVASLARPSGNITGLTDSHGDLATKRLEIFKEMNPSIKKVAVLMDPARRSHAVQLKALRMAARTLDLTVSPIRFHSRDDFPRVVSDIESERPDALMHFGYALIASHRRKIAELGIEKRMPTLGTIAPSVYAGFLASYGTSLRAMYRRVATYVDKILKGAKPADLPVAQPTRFYLTINLKTARALGITFPRSILLRADRVIE